MPDINQALALMKARLNRMPADTTLDDYFIARIQAAQEELNRMFRADLDDSMADLLLLVDFAVWSYQCRYQSGAQPQWLRQRLRERFLKPEFPDEMEAMRGDLG